MRNAVLGSFLGFVMAAGVLAACGGSGGGGSTSLTVDELALRVAELEARLQALTGDASGNLVLTDANLTVQGGNLIVRNGLGTTPTTNGAGNVIIGYNEFRVSGNDRSGSHMLVVGSGLNVSSYGGIVAGHVSSTEAPYASVTGGYRNRATGEYASVTGGEENQAAGLYASVGGAARTSRPANPPSWVAAGTTRPVVATRRSRGARETWPAVAPPPCSADSRTRSGRPARTRA